MAIFDEFNNALPEFEKAFGETWGFNGQNFPAIVIDQQTFTTKRTLGGKMVDGAVIVTVAIDVWNQSGAKKGSVITVRGQEFSIDELDQDAIADIDLVCGSAQLDLWKR